MIARQTLLADAPERVVIALGSEGRGDDGVGLAVARKLTGKLSNCRIISGQDDCMAIVNAWDGAIHSVVVDAANSGAKAGTIHRLSLDVTPLPRELARCSSHGTGLAEAIELARILGKLPRQLVIYAIEAHSFKPGDSMASLVEKAADEVACRIEEELTQPDSSTASTKSMTKGVKDNFEVNHHA